MNIKDLDKKTLAECQGYEFSAIRVTKETGYKYIRIKLKGAKSEDGETVLLSRNASNGYSVGDKPKGNLMFTWVTYDDGREPRMKVGQSAEYFSAEDLEMP